MWLHCYSDVTKHSIFLMYFYYLYFESMAYYLIAIYLLRRWTCKSLTLKICKCTDLLKPVLERNIIIKPAIVFSYTISFYVCISMCLDDNIQHLTCIVISNVEICMYTSYSLICVCNPCTYIFLWKVLSNSWHLICQSTSASHLMILAFLF